jgi:hypothetical protein
VRWYAEGCPPNWRWLNIEKQIGELAEKAEIRGEENEAKE